MMNMLLILPKIFSFFGIFRRRSIKWPLDIVRLFGFNLPRISVIVVNYNYGHYLISRLDSIISQTIGIYEIIVVDDASDDDSLQVLNDWNRKQKIHLTVIQSKNTAGSVFLQWKKGIEAVSGDLVWIAEADDLSDPDFLQTVLKPMLEDPSIVLSYCESRQIDGSGSLYADNYDFYLQHASDKLWTSDRVADGKSEITGPLAILNSIPNVSAALFRRTALVETAQRYSEELACYKIAADYAFYVRLLLQGKLAYSRKSANVHRRHPDSVIARCDRMDLYHEIVSVQQWVMELFTLDDAIINKLHDYREYMIREMQPDS